MKDWFVLGLVFVLFGLLFSGVFYLGRRFERRVVEKYLPSAMEGVCSDCNDLGRKEGYQKGLQTCNDVLNSIDEGGHR